MTAGTLSTLPNWMFPRDRHARPGDAGAGLLRRARLDPDHVFRVPAAPMPADPRANGRAECEARGLLNLIALATRCLANGSNARTDESERWRAEVEHAQARLEALYASGLPRDFLTNPAKHSAK